MWIMGLSADKTILQVGSWLEDEKPSIAERQGFSLGILFRWLCDVWEAGRPTGWPHMNNGSRTSSIDSSTGEVEQVREPAADRHTPLFFLSRLSLKSLNSLARFRLSNVIYSVYCLYGGVSVRLSHVYSSECMYTHCSCVCVSPCRCETTEWQMIHTKVSRVHRFLFLCLV